MISRHLIVLSSLRSRMRARIRVGVCMTQTATGAAGTFGCSVDESPPGLGSSHTRRLASLANNAADDIGGQSTTSYIFEEDT